ncbi:MAG: Ig-like domain-containing protein [Prevotella sp.]|nr:Ig-like domain-containing protein [Prevotella sp.]
MGKPGAYFCQVSYGEGCDVMNSDYVDYEKLLTINNVTYVINEDATATVLWVADMAVNITIPETVCYDGVNYPVTSISSKAFVDCTSLASVKCKTLDAPSLLGGATFEGLAGVFIPSNITIYVPAGSAELYLKTDHWHNFNIIEELPIAESVTLDKTTAEMTEGETLTLTATVSPEDATDKTVAWTSSDETIATVANGVVTALKAGKVTITAKSGEVSATCEITVNAKVIPATGIALDKTTAELTEGETLTLTATVTPEDATDKTVTWTSSDETVATVANGVVAALKAGKATITAANGGNTATCELTVNAKTSDDRFYIPDFEIAAGESKQIAIHYESSEIDKRCGFQFDLYLPEGLTVEKKKNKYNFTFNTDRNDDHTMSSSDQPDGAIRVVGISMSSAQFWEAAGEFIYFTVTAASDFTGSHEVRLSGVQFSTLTGTLIPIADSKATITGKTNVIPATGITLDKTTAELTEGETLTLTATVTPENATDKTVVWTSSDETVATVRDGVVTALKAGKATITAKSGEVSATCEITVNAKVIPATGITLDKTTAELTEGEILTLTATVTPENATDKTVTWTSSDETVATVKDGVVTALKAGKATITAKAGEVSVTCEITVNAKVIPATGIALDKTTAELTEGETLTLTATVTPEDATDKTVAWTSSDETVATVKDGVVTALKAGKVTITAKSGEVSATCEITVNAKVIPATGITLDKTTAELTEGETLALTATVTPEDATDKTVTWTSSDETVATVKDGVVTALKAGKATITAKAGEVSATCKITVNAKVIPATGITLDKTTAEMIEGETLTLTATVSPEDATDKTVTWTSSDETVATVKDGVVTALKAGKVTITAKAGEVSATCEITVNAKVIPATGITLDKTAAELTEGETLTLTATVSPEDATDKTVTWASSDEAVVKVVNGVVSALKTGKATITATSGDVSATCEITVIPVTGINGVIYSDGYAAGNVYTVAGNLVCRKGEKLSSLPKGLYIVDGKKIVVK